LEKRNLWLIPTGNVLLIPQEQDWEEPGELVVPSFPCRLCRFSLYRTSTGCPKKTCCFAVC